MKEKESFGNCQMNYMSMVQGVINRMATCSVTIKGFAATIFAGILAIVLSGDEPFRWLALLIAMVVIFAAFSLDWYYYYQEMQYRTLYDEIRKDAHTCDFNMRTPKYADITRRSTLKSLSLWPYYGMLEIILIISLIFTSIVAR